MKKLLAMIRFLFRKRLQISPDSIATQIKDHHFKITELEVENYCSIVEEKPSRSNNKENKWHPSIHPLYLTKISWHIVENLNDFLEQPMNPKLLEMLVHMSNHFEYFGKLEFDKEYCVKSRLCRIQPHKKGTRLTVRFEYYQQDRLVVVEHTSGLLFGVKCAGEGQEFGSRPVNLKVKENLIWSKKLRIEKDLPYEYADKACIDAPIHTDPKFAKSIGLQDIILQGTCTFSKAVSFILSDASPSFEIVKNKIVKSLSVNFTGMLFTPNEIAVRVLYQTEEKIVFDVLDNKGKAVIKGGNIIL